MTVKRGIEAFTGNFQKIINLYSIHRLSFKFLKSNLKIVIIEYLNQQNLHVMMLSQHIWNKAI